MSSSYHTVALYLLVAQGLMGAYDTIYHHELRAALPQQTSAIVELKIHAMRGLLYGVVFISVAWFIFGGAWFWVFFTLVFVEICLSLWDFLVEDRDRQLPWSERVLHTLLAINGGAAFGLLATQGPYWLALPNELFVQTHGWLTLVLSLFGIGVALSGVRDACAARHLQKQAKRSEEKNFPSYVRPDKPLSILITGGTGFIGQHLIQHWLPLGHRITVLTRRHILAARLFKGKVRTVQSLHELHAHDTFEVIVNLAGAPILTTRWTEVGKALLRKSRINLTQELVEWIQNATHKPKVFLTGSAIGYYGHPGEDGMPALNETRTHQKCFISELCQAWESAAQPAQTVTQLIVLRLGLVLGLQHALPAMLIPIQLGVGGKIGSGNQWFSWIHIDDVVRAIDFLMADALKTDLPTSSSYASPARTYNLVAPNAVRQQDFAKLAARIHRRPIGFGIPERLLKFFLGERSSLLLKSQRVKPQRLLEAGFSFAFPELETALNDLR